MTPPDDHPDEALQGRSTTIKNDNWILAQPFLRLRELYRTEGGALPDPILNLTWGYTNPGDPDLEKIAQDVNGYNRQPAGHVRRPRRRRLEDRGQLDLHRFVPR